MHEVYVGVNVTPGARIEAALRQRPRPRDKSATLLFPSFGSFYCRCREHQQGSCLLIPSIRDIH